MHEKSRVKPQPTVVLPPLSADPGPEPAALNYRILVRKYLPVALLLIILGAFAGLAALITDTPMYKARVLLEIQNFSANLSGSSASPILVSDDQGGVNLETQIRLLQSGPVVGEVVDNMLKQPAPAPVRPDVFAKLRHRARRASADPKAILEQGVMTAADSFDARPVNGTRLVELSCESTHPALAAAFLNNVASRFIQETDRSRTESAEKTNQWLTQRFEDTKVKLQQAEVNLRNFVAKSGNIFADPDHTLDDVKLTQLQGDLAKAQTDRIAKQARYQTALNSKPESVPEIAADDTYQTLRSKLEDLRNQRTILSETLTPKHYKIQRLDAQEQELLASEKDEITAVMNRLRNEYEDAARHEKLLASAYASQGGQVNAQAGNAAQYIALKRDVDNLRQMYDTTLQRINQSGAPGSLPIAPIRLVEPCSPPSAPYKPRPATTIGFGIVAGLALSVGFAFLRERADRSVKAPGTARILLNIPELGVIPAAGKLPRNANRGLFVGVKRQQPLSISGQIFSGTPVAEDRSVVHAAWEQGVSMLAESFRTTLASLMREAGTGTSSKAIMITSPQAGDGKTTITSNLGMALAESGRRVVIVDADFRRPRIAKVFGISGSTTLEALIGGTSPVADYPLDRIAVETSTSGLWILPSYPSETHISRLIYSPRLPLILDRLRREFDVVLLDVPPILELADARVIGQFVDGVALVIRAGETDRESALAACQCLADDGVPLLGSVLNNLDPRWGKQGSYGYYYNSR